MTAKTNGLEELAQSILDSAGLTEDDVSGVLPPVKRSTLRPPAVVTQTFEYNWPSVGVTESFFDRALAAAASGEPSGQDEDYEEDLLEQAVAGEQGGLAWAAEDRPLDKHEAEEAEDAWGVGGDEHDADALDPDGHADGLAAAGGAGGVGIDGEEELGGSVTPGIPESELWVRNSPLAADHVAAGSFETAMGLLNRQVGIVDFRPLKPLFLSVYRSSRLWLPAAPSLPPLAVPLRRNLDSAEPRNVLPVVALSLQSITTGELRSAYTAFQKAKFVDAVNIFRSILQSLLLVVTSSPAQAAEASFFFFRSSLSLALFPFLLS